MGAEIQFCAFRAANNLKERSRDQCRRPRRRGQSLIVMMLLLLAIVGVLALTLDFGFVLLSRRTMQTAVNTGALEGARNLDGNGREDAREVIRNVFDDNLDPTENLTTLGAGPDHSLIQRDSNDQALLGNGTGECDLFESRHQYTYRPDPELNLDNETHGDLVVGDYDGGVGSANELSDYRRDDFVADDAGQAFLSRIRRTPERAGVANPLDRMSGVSSSGSGSPLLMGHLMTFLPSSSGTYDIRRDGVAIRATAIAENQPIVSIGSASSEQLFTAVSFVHAPSLGQHYRIADPRYNLGEIAVFDATTDSVSYSEIPPGYFGIIEEHFGNWHVVGFGLKDTPQSADPEFRLPNASPRLSDAWPTLSALPEETRDAVLQRHRELAEQQDSVLARLPILVPANH